MTRLSDAQHYNRDTGSLATWAYFRWGTVCGTGGPITAATDIPGGPVLAGDHRQRDTPRPDHTIPIVMLLLPAHCYGNGVGCSVASPVMLNV